MVLGVMDAPVPPQPEDFGLSGHNLESLPRPRIKARQGLCVAVVYGSAVALVLFAALALSGSVIAAVFFGILLVAAGSVLLIPAVTGLVCAMERCEHHWLCRRYGAYRALSEYRRAMAEHEVAQHQYEVWHSRTLEDHWRQMDQRTLVTETAELYRRAGKSVRKMVPHDRAGVDLLIVSDASVTAIRCVADPVDEGLTLGRELAAARLDAGADRLLLVSPRGVDEELAEYLASHAGTILDAGDLATMGSATVY